MLSLLEQLDFNGTSSTNIYTASDKEMPFKNSLRWDLQKKNLKRDRNQCLATLKRERERKVPGSRSKVYSQACMS